MLFAADTSETIRVNNIPFIQLSLNQYSYMNAKAARLLGFKHGDTLRFFHNFEKTQWYICNDSEAGAMVRKYDGLLKFSDRKNVRTIFDSFLISGTRVNFPVSDQIETFKSIKVIQIINKPFNLV